MTLESSHFEVTNIQLEIGTTFTTAQSVNSGAIGNLVLDASASSDTIGLTDENAPIQLEEIENVFRNTGFGSIVLDGTDSSGTNANSNINDEIRTEIEVLKNATVIIDVTSEGAFDSNQIKFDSVQITFDGTI